MVMKQRTLGGSASHIKVGEIGYGLMGTSPLTPHRLTVGVHHGGTEDSR